MITETDWQKLTDDLENAQAVNEAQAGTIRDLKRDVNLATDVIKKCNAWIEEAKPLLDSGGEANARLDWILAHGYALESEAGRINLSGSRETVLAAIDAGRKLIP